MPEARITTVSDAELRRQLTIRRAIHLFLAIVVVVPFLCGIKLLGTPSPLVKQIYDDVDVLDPGSAVLFSLDFDPASQAELAPMTIAALRHCFKKDLHPLVMTHWPAGVGLHKKLLEETAEEFAPDKKSGRDYVFLGYRPGGLSVILGMGDSITGAFDKDYYNKITEGMEALEGVGSLKDIDYALVLAAGATIDGLWIPYGHDRYGFPIGAGCTAVMAPDLYPFEQSKQITGIIGGMRGAADYEVLIDVPGVASSGMAAQSFAHLYIIGLIIVANIEEFVKKRSKKKD